MASLSFDQVSKRFGDKVIVDRFDLEVADGELVVLVGGSGCGKSTTLRMVAGLETVSSGTIRIGDRDVTGLAPRARDVAMVFQDYALYPHLDAYDNMALGLRLRKVPQGDIDRRVREAAEMLDIVPLLDRKPRQMSGGQRQRVAIGRAVVRSPSAFLFDEPLSNLDAHLRNQMRVEIHRVQRSLGTTSIYVTHDQVEAMTLADRIVILEGGVIQQVGRPMEVYRAPVNRFVAAFIGSPSMNFFGGRIEEEGGELAFTGRDVRIPIPASRRPGGGERDGLTLGVRPEDLGLAADRPGRPALAGRLALVERLGGITHLHVEIGDSTVIAAVATDRDLEAGDAIELAVDPARLHLFAANGAALA
jgi:ABC-type sugar transport system ATPase subunit